MDLNITFAAETDTGLKFGADIDLDEIDGGGGRTSIPSDRGPHIVYVGGSFGTFTMGDTDGALDWAMTEVDALTTIDDAHTVHLGFSGNGAADTIYDGQVLRYDYSFENFGIAASLQIDDTDVGDPQYGIGVRGNFDLGGFDLSLGAGYQANDYVNNTIPGDYSFNIWGVSAAFEVAGFEVVLNYSDASEAPVKNLVIDANQQFDLDYSATDGRPVDYTQYAIGVTYEWEAWGFHANYGKYEFDNIVGSPGATADTDGYGLAVMYELGEGISASAGYGKSDGSGSGGGSIDTDIWSLGLVMTF